MKKLLFMLALAVAGTAGKAHAQMHDDIRYSDRESRRYKAMSATEKHFNAGTWVSVRDFVYLKNDTKAIFELRSIQDYPMFHGIDTILAHLIADIGFYHDSLDNGSGSIRIDYSIHNGDARRELRFIKHPQPGDAFVIHNGDTHRLKVEHDTVRIIIQNVKPAKYLPATLKTPDTTVHNYTGSYFYPIQLTLILNDYRNIGKLLAEKDIIVHAIDTLASVRTGKENNPFFPQPSSVIFRPYGGGEYTRSARMVKFRMLLEEEYGQVYAYSLPQHRFAFYGNISTGLVRNTLAPGAEAGITLLTHYRRGYQRDYAFTSLYSSALFFFERGAGREFHTHDNCFVNLETGTTNDKEILGVKIRSISIGGGYLFAQQGDVFSGTTVKLFAGIRLPVGLTLYPEVIATDNFAHIFPGMSLKIFGFRRESYM